MLVYHLYDEFLDLDLNPDTDPEIVDIIELNFVYWSQRLTERGTLGGYNYAPPSKSDYENQKLHHRRPIKKHAQRLGRRIFNPEDTWLWFYL